VSPYPHTLEASRLPTFESFVSELTADKLKVLARQLVGKEAYKMNKAACLAAVLGAMGDESTIRSMVRGLSPLETFGLGLVKRRGGLVAPAEEVAGELLMFDARTQGRARGYGFYEDEARYTALNSLLERGLLIRIDGSRAAMARYSACPLVVADARILAHVEVTPPSPRADRPSNSLRSEKP
jgi:hypothetical protein